MSKLNTDLDKRLEKIWEDSSLAELTLRHNDIKGPAFARELIKIKQKAKAQIKTLVTQAERRARIDELEHWLGLVTWPNTYLNMQKDMKDRLEALSQQGVEK